MLKHIHLAVLLFVSLNIVAQTTVTYQASTADFANPERGFYRYTEARSGSYAILDESTLSGYRLLHTPPTASYAIYSTLIFRYFFLEDFKTSNISDVYLDNMQDDFNAARLAGVKVIPRFAYTDEVDGSGCTSWICPPYGDASKAWILTHINQLKPVLEANKDVIATVQMGFVGVWGENYYTDYLGDASQGPDYKLTDQNWTDRVEILTELLDAVPAERMVQVRYPQQKQRAIYGINALTNAAALTIGEAFSGSNKARLAFHNDCLLASSDDFGTYTDYGNSSSSSTSDTTNLKAYLADDSQFVVVGGETCNDGYSPQNNCASTSASAFGDSELERMHFSYLNSQYNNDVNNDWVAGGCMDEVKRRLGYRFELQSGTFSNSAQAGQVIDVGINLKNIGYASPYNERGVEVMLRHTISSEVWFASLGNDPRFWFAGNAIHAILETICVPNEMPIGTYEVLLHLPDPMTSLYALPEYSIRLGNLLPDNSDVWEASTGYNKLGHFITIDNSASNSACNGEITLSKLASLLPVDLISFQARQEQEDIVVTWATSAEYNNEGFHLERRTNNEGFSKIAWKESKGDSDERNYYTFRDTEVKSNIDYYYRLIQKDRDGTLAYSRIAAARVNENTGSPVVKVYPNPTNSQIVIDYDENQIDLPLKISILNALGVQVMPSITNTRIIDISFLPKGIYFIEIIIEEEKMISKISKN